MSSLTLGKTHLSPKIMGILNCTPDSFHDGADEGQSYFINKGMQLIADGADLIDIGGESTRPGALSIESSVQISRIVPVIRAIVKKHSVPISVDTTRYEVAEAAFHAGASIVNDTSMLRDSPRLVDLLRGSEKKIILMHSRGTPQTMDSFAVYDDVLSDVMTELKNAAALALESGLRTDQILIDPGIGFAKTADQNILLMKNMRHFKSLGFPVVVGVSRKKVIGVITHCNQSADRLIGSVAAHMILASDVDVLRVHDVLETKQALEVKRCLI